MEWLTPKMVEVLMGAAREGGLAFTLLLVIIAYILEVRRGMYKDKIIAAKEKANTEFQVKMLELVGEMKTVISNGNLLLEMLTRGRK
jgi:hypothetical protein